MLILFIPKIRNSRKPVSAIAAAARLVSDNQQVEKCRFLSVINISNKWPTDVCV
jgi:hypothetical protein